MHHVILFIKLSVTYFNWSHLLWHCHVLPYTCIHWEQVVWVSHTLPVMCVCCSSGSIPAPWASTVPTDRSDRMSVSWDFTEKLRLLLQRRHIALAFTPCLFWKASCLLSISIGINIIYIRQISTSVCFCCFYLSLDFCKQSYFFCCVL